jgi:hypothetical protein
MSAKWCIPDHVVDGNKMIHTGHKARKRGAMYKLKITEASGAVWHDDNTWVDIPDQEDCEREYNPGCTIEITDENGNDIDVISI